MPLEGPAEPWCSYLDEVAAGLDVVTELHCMGGFAMVQGYGMARSTGDVDVIAVVPGGSAVGLRGVAGRGSALHLRTGVYLDVVTVATVPEDYASRLVPLFAGRWERLRLFVLEAHDLALSKLERNFERDRADVAFLASTGRLKAEVLRQRYWDEMRPYVIGRESWHDQTLALWLEAYLGA